MILERSAFTKYTIWNFRSILTKITKNGTYFHFYLTLMMVDKSFLNNFQRERRVEDQNQLYNKSSITWNSLKIFNLIKPPFFST